MTIVIPSAVVTQQFALLSPEATQDLPACIIGPKRHVVTHGVADASASEYGAYDPDSNTDHELLTLPAGEAADSDSIKVLFEEAYGRYAQFSGADLFNPDSSQDNKINADSSFSDYLTYLESEAAGSPFQRNATLGERDVKVGDYARITHEDGTLLSKITSIEFGKSNVTADSANSMVAAATNKASQATSFAVAKLQGNTADSRLTGDFTQSVAYHGDFAGGFISDVYVITCITAGDYGTAQFSVSSTNGDNVSVVTSPADDSTPMAVGSHGLSILIDNVETRNFEVGEKWQFTVAAVYDAPVVQLQATGAIGGTPYDFGPNVTLDKDAVYTVKVVKGGHFGSESTDPKVIVTTDNNVDSSPPVTVAEDNTAVPFGSLGLELLVDDGTPPQGLLAGETFSLALNGRKQTGAKNFTLQDPIPKTDSGGGAINGATFDLGVEFLVRADSIEIPSDDYPDNGDQAWELNNDGDTVNIKSGVEILDASVVDGSNDPLPIPVVQAQVAISYTAIIKIGAPDKGTISSQSSIEGILGPIVPENEVAYGVYRAIQNSGGQPVKFITTPGDDLSAYNEALAVAEADEGLYWMTPMTDDLTISNAVISHVLTMSEPKRARERHAIVARDDQRTRHMVQFKPGTTDTYGGYVADNGSSEFVSATIPGATLITDGVASGDILRINFEPQAGGGETYESYTIASVEDEENFTLAEGPTAAIGSVGAPVRVEIVREQDRDEWADQVAAQSESFGNRRVSRGFGGETILDDADLDVPAYFVNAAYAGLASGVLPHQPITNVQLVGFKNLPDMVNVFTPAELETLILGGTLVYMQDVTDGPIYILKQTTTDTTDENTSERSVVANGDSISKFLRNSVRPFIGRNNITENFEVRLRTLLAQKVDFLQSETESLEAGPQVTEIVGDIQVNQSEINRTHVEVEMELRVPYPANVIDINLFFT